MTADMNRYEKHIATLVIERSGTLQHCRIEETDTNFTVECLSNSNIVKNDYVHALKIYSIIRDIVNSNTNFFLGDVDCHRLPNTFHGDMGSFIADDYFNEYKTVHEFYIKGGYLYARKTLGANSIGNTGFCYRLYKNSVTKVLEKCDCGTSLKRIIYGAAQRVFILNAYHHLMYKDGIQPLTEHSIDGFIRSIQNLEKNNLSFELWYLTKQSHISHYSERVFNEICYIRPCESDEVESFIKETAKCAVLDVYKAVAEELKLETNFSEIISNLQRREKRF